MDSVCSFSRGKVAASVKRTTYLHLVAISRVVELYLHSTVRLQDVMLDELNKGITIVTCDNLPIAMPLYLGGKKNTVSFGTELWPPYCFPPVSQIRPPLPST
jgi:hypothetical protein